MIARRTFGLLQKLALMLMLSAFISVAFTQEGTSLQRFAYAQQQHERTTPIVEMYHHANENWVGLVIYYERSDNRGGMIMLDDDNFEKYVVYTAQESVLVWDGRSATNWQIRNLKEVRINRDKFRDLHPPTND